MATIEIKRFDNADETRPFEGNGRTRRAHWRWTRAVRGSGRRSRRAVAQRQFKAGGQPRAQLLPIPGVHSDLAAPTALAVTHEHRAATRVKVALTGRERFLNTQPAAPQHHYQGARL